MKTAILASAIVVFALLGIVLIIVQIMNTVRLKKQTDYFEQLHKDLKPGVEVLLAAGIYGTIKKVTDEYVIVEVAKGIDMKASRYSIKEIIKK